MEEEHLSECKTVRLLIDAIAEMHAANPEKIIALLQDYLWDEEEVEVIKGQNVEVRGCATTETKEGN